MMTPEERDELIHFILQCQANAANIQQEMVQQRQEHEARLQENAAKLQENSATLQAHDAALQDHRATLEEHAANLQQVREHTTQIQALASLGHDLVEHARIQARRLDRLENLNP